jgi:hypothetical protein
MKTSITHRRLSEVRTPQPFRTLDLSESGGVLETTFATGYRHQCRAGIPRWERVVSPNSAKVAEGHGSSPSPRLPPGRFASPTARSSLGTLHVGNQGLFGSRQVPRADTLDDRGCDPEGQREFSNFRREAQFERHVAIERHITAIQPFPQCGVGL